MTIIALTFPCKANDQAIKNKKLIKILQKAYKKLEKKYKKIILPAINNTLPARLAEIEASNDEQEAAIHQNEANITLLHYKNMDQDTRMTNIEMHNAQQDEQIGELHETNHNHTKPSNPILKLIANQNN